MKKILFDLFTALLNATLLLVIIALLLLVILLDKLAHLEQLPEQIAQNITTTIVSDAAMPIEALAKDIHALDVDVDGLNQKLQQLLNEPALQDSAQIQAELHTMNQQLIAINGIIDRSAQQTEQAFVQIKQSIDGFTQELKQLEKRKVSQLGQAMAKSILAAFQCKSAQISPATPQPTTGNE